MCSFAMKILCGSMIRLEKTHINVLTKMDLFKEAR
jgi:hypothetical protein